MDMDIAMLGQEIMAESAAFKIIPYNILIFFTCEDLHNFLHLHVHICNMLINSSLTELSTDGRM